MEEFSEALNDILVEIYNNVIDLEEKVVNSVSRKLNLSISEIHFLEAVSKGKEKGYTVSEIADELGITKPSVTVAVNKLEKKGYLEKRQCQDDGRAVRVFLTREGIKVNSCHQYFHKRMVRSISEGLDEHEREFLVKTISKLNNYFKQTIESVK